MGAARSVVRSRANAPHATKAVSKPKQQGALAQKMEMVTREVLSSLKGKLSKSKVQAKVQMAATPVLAEAINTAASVAAAAAAKRVKLIGLEPGHARKVVAKAAESAALRTKQEGLRFLEVSI